MNVQNRLEHGYVLVMLWIFIAIFSVQQTKTQLFKLLPWMPPYFHHRNSSHFKKEMGKVNKEGDNTIRFWQGIKFKARWTAQAVRQWGQSSEHTPQHHEVIKSPESSSVFSLFHSHTLSQSQSAWRIKADSFYSVRSSFLLMCYLSQSDCLAGVLGHYISPPGLLSYKYFKQ